MRLRQGISSHVQEKQCELKLSQLPVTTTLLQAVDYVVLHLLQYKMNIITKSARHHIHAFLGLLHGADLNVTTIISLN